MALIACIRDPFQRNFFFNQRSFGVVPGNTLHGVAFSTEFEVIDEIEPSQKSG